MADADETLLRVVPGGDYAASLAAIRDVLTDRLADAGARDAAALSRELSRVLTELEALRAPEEADPVDEIARRRAARLADASSQ